MPNLKTHCAISKQRTGRNFEGLHRWIDQFREQLGHEHRMERHYFNEEDKNTIKKCWEEKGKGLGEKAVIEWLFHIAIDNLDTAFRMSSKRFSYGRKTYNLMQFGMSRSHDIYCDFKRVNDSALPFMF